MNSHGLLGHFVSLWTTRRPTFSFGFILSFRPAIVKGPRTSPIFNGLHFFSLSSPLFPRWTKSVYSDSRAVQNCFYQLVTRPVSSAPHSIESVTLLVQPGSRVKNNRIEPQGPIETLLPEKPVCFSKHCPTPTRFCVLYSKRAY